MPETFETLFPKESKLRDYLVDHLELVEPGLELVAKEYELGSAHGAGGKIDILAKDSQGQFVVIELKKSDQAARAALHELSKYITLLGSQEKIGRRELRCIVVSSEWHELLQALSYFREMADVHVDGVRVFVDANGEPQSEKVALIPAGELPQFAPEFDLFLYETAAERDTHWDWISERSKQIPFVRAALCLLNPKSPGKPEDTIYRSILCIWRIEDDHLATIESTCDIKIGRMAPYAFPGWEPECDILKWLASEGTALGFAGSMELQRGTAEKVQNQLDRYDMVEVRYCNRNPKKPPLIDLDRMREILKGADRRLPLGRHNPRAFKEIISRRNPVTWSQSIDLFLEVIRFIPIWKELAESFLAYVVDGVPAAQTVELHFSDKKHIFYAIHQARVHPEAQLSKIQITLMDESSQVIGGMVGTWSWDGSCPADAAAAMKEVYGNLRLQKVMLFSAVDANRYESGYTIHGFQPIVAFFDIQPNGQLGIVGVHPKLPAGNSPPDENALQLFVKANPEYVEEVAKLFGGIPTQPGDGAHVF